MSIPVTVHWVQFVGAPDMKRPAWGRQSAAGESLATGGDVPAAAAATAGGEPGPWPPALPASAAEHLWWQRRRHAVADSIHTQTHTGDECDFMNQLITHADGSLEVVRVGPFKWDISVQIISPQLVWTTLSSPPIHRQIQATWRHAP